MLGRGVFCQRHPSGWHQQPDCRNSIPGTVYLLPDKFYLQRASAYFNDPLNGWRWSYYRIDLYRTFAGNAYMVLGVATTQEVIYMKNRPLISVCVCTYKRPDMLHKLLTGLLAQKVSDFHVEIIIVDNDANGSAKETVDKFLQNFQNIPVSYIIEPKQNIALARNATVSLARGEWLAFIDDDECPNPEWLRYLKDTAEMYSADGVFGPIIPVLPESAPRWIQRGRFHERPRLPTGTFIKANNTRTGNALIKASLLKEKINPFDPRFGRTGGEDHFLFMKLVSDGSRFAWCDEAQVYEAVSSPRVTLSWLLKRAFRGGQVFAIQQRDLKGFVPSMYLGVYGLCQLVISFFLCLISLPLGVHISVSWLMKAVAGLGKLMALTPYCFEEYRD